MSFMDAQRMSKTMHQTPYTVTIASGAAVSSQVIIENTFMLGVAVLNTGGAWTAANIGLEVSMDGGTSGTWTPVYDETNTRVMITNMSTTARRLCYLPTAAIACMRYRFLRLVSVNTSTGANVNQGGLRTLEVSILG
jgi:hypothetical protein